jgi:hypothetical protein
MAGEYDAAVRSAPEPPDTVAAMSEARLVVKGIRVQHRPTDLYVYDDVLVLTHDDGERRIPLRDLERVATRRTWGRGARLLLELSGGEVVDIRRLSASSTVTAHRTIVEVARRFH